MHLWLLFLALGFTGFVLGLGAVVWSIRSGQWDDLETPGVRILDDDLPPATGTPRPSPQPPTP